jgi:hypothetical protein
LLADLLAEAFGVYPRSTGSVGDREIQECARELFHRYGSDASATAAQNVRELSALHDEEGRAAWQRIGREIERLRRDFVPFAIC